MPFKKRTTRLGLPEFSTWSYVAFLENIPKNNPSEPPWKQTVLPWRGLATEATSHHPWNSQKTVEDRCLVWIPSSKLTWQAGKSPFWIGDASSKGPFSIAMLVYWSAFVIVTMSCFPGQPMLSKYSVCFSCDILYHWYTIRTAWNILPPTSKEKKTRWWLNQPIWKNLSQNGFIFPKFRGENSKNVWVATSQKRITPWKFNIAPENDGWKMSFLLGFPIFRGYVKLRGGTLWSTP